MAHRSKKKHIKHVHQHEPATPKAKSPIAKAEAAARGIAKKARTAPELMDTGKRKAKGIVGRLAARARKATKRIAKPRAMIAKAKNRVTKRVKSLLGSDEK